MSSKNILLDGLNMQNTIFNDKLYISDPIRYIKMKEESVRNINMKLFQQLLIDLTMRDLKMMRVSKQKIERIAELLWLKDDEALNSIYLKNLLDTPIYTDDIDNILTLTKKL